jgi:chemosensory pili system protein ChpA (sensor histidine kinase/response regulator)
MAEVASQTLELVGRELNATLNEARVAVENFIEQPDNVALLQRSVADLHQVQGVLRVLEIYGAALLAEEMEQVARYLVATSAERKNQAESLDALLRAMVQLPGYLERVLAGGRDLALVLLPMLNDLRAVRGSPLLSEGTLLLLNLKSDRQAAPIAPIPGEQPLTISQWARRLRARFQVGLIGWIRGERIDQNLEILAAVAYKLEQVATRQPVFQLWWVTGALIEALRERGLEGGVSIKRLLGLADREIKRLYEEGEARYCQSPPVELLNNLLYYIARADSAGAKVASVRASFRLGDLLPVDEAIEQERENLSAPSVKLMRTVAAAIREDLAKVKDVLDIFVRRGGGQAAELAPQVELLRKIGDTLGVLGLGELRTRVQSEIARLGAIVAGQATADDATLLEIAATLIGIEDHLDEQLVGMIVPKAKAGADEPAGDAEFQQVQAAVLRECMLNLARVKEAVAQSVGGTLDAAGLDSWAALMRGIQAGLAMLGRTRAVEIVDGIARTLKRVMQPGIPAVPALMLDRLADAIVSVEYYMETLQAGRSEPFYMLDNAQACLDALAAQPEPAVPTVPPLPESTFAQTLRITPAAVAGAIARVDLEATDAPGVQPPVLAGLPAGPPPAAMADPELVALFIEEAGEEVAKIAREYPRWDENPLEDGALSTVRRSFHTLKGSGRMVGARDMAEFAWAIENLLNRLIDKTLTRSPAILAALREAVKALPQLLKALETGAPAGIDFAPIIARAHSLAAGQGASPDPVADTMSTSAQPVLAAVTDAPQPEDPALREIFTREIAAHIATVRAFLVAERTLPAPHLLNEDVYRACHTLRGSSKAAEARHGIRVAEPLDHWLRKAFDAGVGLTASDLALVADCMQAMESIVGHLDEATGFFFAHDALRKRIATAEFELDQRMTAALAVPAAAIAPVAVPAPPVPPAPAVSADFDPEMAAVFAEEAGELVETLEGALTHWNGDRANGEHLTALKRPLHTLKGGARMAGVLAMGDLAHEVETLVGQIELGAVPADDTSATALLSGLDALAQMRDALAGGRAVERADALVARLRALDPSRAPAASPPPAPAPAALPVAATTANAPLPAAAAPTAEGGDDPWLTIEFTPSSDDPTHEVLALASGDSAIEAQPFEEIELPSELDDGSTAEASPPDGGATVEVPSLAGARRASDAPLVEAPVVEESAPSPVTDTVDSPGRAATPLADAAATAAATAWPPRVAVPRAAEGLVPPAPVPPGREPVARGERQELARVDAGLLDQLLNYSGEVSIGRARLEQQVASIDFNLAELSRTVTRLKEQLRKLELETESQILHTHEDEAGHRAEFDPLELDRYSTIQQYSRGLAETASDVASIQQLLENLTQDTQNLLTQQARTITELQNGLMRTRMVPFQRHVQRLVRIVRQAASETGKRAELSVEGASGELDRQVLERMLPPFEHMVRNAVVHGLELPTARVARGKDETGRIALALRREGAEVIVQVSDDGAGMNLKAIRDKGQALGLIRPGQVLSDEDVTQLVLEPGFSTAGRVTQHSGRGVGMDVVATEVKKLGGALHMETREGEGTVFTIRLPLTLAISHALVVRTGDEFYALPVPTVEGVVRLTKAEVAAHLGPEAPPFEHNGQRFRFQFLAQYVGLEPSPLPEQDVTIPVILVRAGEHSTGLIADELVGSREIVVKSVGPQISAIRGISGATILGDGRIVVILDINALVRAEWRGRSESLVPRDRTDQRTFALVVDDSITVRRVTQRLLERNGMRVLTARDGQDAIELLQEHVPDVILLDIEMPRMDGYEVAAQVRADARLADVPIIMITSRVGEKHRARAIELGVDDYLGKPYQEAQLLEAIEPLVSRRRDRALTARAGARR